MAGHELRDAANALGFACARSSKRPVDLSASSRAHREEYSIDGKPTIVWRGEIPSVHVHLPSQAPPGTLLAPTLFLADTGSVWGSLADLFAAPEGSHSALGSRSCACSVDFLPPPASVRIFR